LKIDEPLMGVSVSVNTSPLAGKEGSKITLNDLKSRLKEEAENDVALTVITEAKGTGSVQVRGRGDLYLLYHVGTSAFSLKSYEEKASSFQSLLLKSSTKKMKKDRSLSQLKKSNLKWKTGSAILSWIR
jgi:alpha-glucosidase (family GH31 glycosyl hydrolase)